MKHFAFILALLVFTYSDNYAQNIDYKHLEEFIVNKLYNTERIPKYQLHYAQKAAKQTLLLATYSKFNEVFHYDPIIKKWKIDDEELPSNLKIFDWEGVVDPNFRWRSRYLTDKQYKQKYLSITISWLIEYMNQFKYDIY